MTDSAARTDSAVGHSRDAALDAVVDRIGETRQAAGAAAAAELFAVVDALDASPTLRRTITDPGIAAPARGQLAQGLFAGKVSPEVAEITAAAAQQRWSGGRRFADALERQGVRLALLAAQSAGTLDEVEDELFRFNRIADGDPALRTALADRSRPATDRVGLIESLLDGRADATTRLLLARAVQARHRTFSLTVANYLDLAAKLRQRVVATVRVARELDEDQLARLTAALTRQTGRPVTLHQVVDPSVIGGVRVEIGDEVIEGTAATKLEAARRHFGH